MYRDIDIDPAGQQDQDFTNPRESLTSAVRDAVWSEVTNDYYAFRGTNLLNTKLKALLKESGVGVAPDRAIAQVASDDGVMEALSDMRRKLGDGEIKNYPFVLAVFLAQFPIVDMSEDLQSALGNFGEVSYTLSPFSTIWYCEKTENLLYDAIGCGQAGTDGFAFLVKTSGPQDVAHTAAIAVNQVVARSNGQEGVIVPGVWYGPSSADVRNAIKPQILGTVQFDAPHTNWQVFRQFNPLDCNFIKPLPDHIDFFRELTTVSP